MNYQFDALIIGSGVAGLSCALELLEQGLSVGLITREKDPKVTNTYWAQGGIVYSPDEMDSLVRDIEQASAGTSSLAAAKTLAEYGPQILQEVLLDKIGVSFERHEKGELKLTQEAAHSKPRIIYQGDYTGKGIEETLLSYLARFPKLTLLTQHTAIDLMTPSHHGNNLKQRYEDHQVVGAYLYHRQTGLVHKVMAKKTILATGGFAALYLHHTNSEGARGDGHAMARRAGAQLINMEFIQFHPTAFYDRHSHRRFLISEALRGEGAKLVNEKGEAFMQNYHPDKELAPRDVVSHSIVSEMLKTRHDNVYLDFTHEKRELIERRFPTIFHFCLDKGYDLSQDLIPVVPAAHYSCGGVKVDLKGRTIVKNLYAIGEVACNGLHGANRLASTSLLEGLTFGVLAARDLAQNISAEVYPAEAISPWKQAQGELDLSLVTQDWMTLKQTMWNYVGLKRSPQRLKRAQAMIRELTDEVGRFYKDSQLDDELVGLRNALEVASTVINSSARFTS